MTTSLAVVRGRSAILLVAPHAGRRDSTRRPWGSTPLKMNDLHTGAVARALAARLDASALLNEDGDRNDVDLNRVSATHARAPWFLDALGDLVEDGLARHERICLLTVHGWNVVQPAVDIGLGVQPCAAALAGDDGAAVSAAFAASVLPRLAARLAANGIAATPGLRYPARARENLLQLFTGRHAGDPRAAVRRLAALAARVDAVQLELSLPLRLPGGWRDVFVDACGDALGTEASAAGSGWPAWEQVSAVAAERAALEFVAPGVSGLAAIDERGGRLLLFLDDGRLVTFTGERVGVCERDRVAGLRLATTAAGVTALSYEGPMLAFPDTTPFVDLERGLASARIVDARVRLELTPSHVDGGEPCPAGTLAGEVRLGATRQELRGHAMRPRRAGTLGAEPRVGVRLADGRIVLGRGDGSGFVCRDGRHAAVRRVGVEHQERDGVVRVRVEADDGDVVEVRLDLLHRLPVVGGDPPYRRVLFASGRHEGMLSGWVEIPLH